MEREHDITRSRRRMRPPGGGSIATAPTEPPAGAPAGAAAASTTTSSGSAATPSTTTTATTTTTAPITPTPAMFSRTHSMEYKNFFVRSKTSERLFSQSGYEDHSTPPASAQPIKIAVLTSGGDAPGMNAAVRAVTRIALETGRVTTVYAVWNGYEGLVEGGDAIRPIHWADVGGILQEGGTFLGTARSQAFRTRAGRLKAAINLLRFGIRHLVVIGGDGSLTGAHILKREWSELVAEAVATEGASLAPISDPLKETLTVVGLVGSIDNDMAGTDMTIGCDSALHRIVQAVDTLSSTAASHQRDFVVEVMGRNCGWLALKGATATGADWVFIPECPASVDWPDQMSSVMRRGKEMGKRSNIIIIAEGAHDVTGKKITSDDVRRELDSRGFESRVTILGHIQRGGAPSAFDRQLSSLMGAKAVEVLLEGNYQEPMVICLSGNRMEAKPLSECLAINERIVQCVKAGNFDDAMRLRGNNYLDSYHVMNTLMRSFARSLLPAASGDPTKVRVAVLHAGACAPGMNAAVRAVVRLGLDRGFSMVGVCGGIAGLQKWDAFELSWMDVNGWAKLGGATLGIDRFDSKKMDVEAIVASLTAQRIGAIVMIGGWCGYDCMLHLYNQRSKYPILATIPIVCLPATISNNLPCTDLCVGADSAIGEIVYAVDKIKQSTVGHTRLYVIEVMGGKCGYLATLGALSTGAELVYLNEYPPTLTHLQKDLDDILMGFQLSKRTAIVVVNEDASKVITTNFLTKLFRTESHGQYDVRTSILGHTQQGGSPSPLDRILATDYAAACVDYVESQTTKRDPAQPPVSACVGMIDGAIKFTPFSSVVAEMDFVHRRPVTQRWMPTLNLVSVLGQAGPSWYIAEYASRLRKKHDGVAAL